MIASAILLMVFRRCITLFLLVSGDVLHRSPDMTAELVALATSVLMLSGIACLAPFFRAIRRTENELQEQRDNLETMVRERTRELGKRLKELGCLYGISDLVDMHGISLKEILQGTVDLIPASWQYPEIACARLVFSDQEFKTENWEETIWKQDADVMVRGEQAGSISVCYLKKKPAAIEGPFLEEERKLINAIAQQLGKIITRFHDDDALRENEECLATTLNSIGDAVIATDAEARVTRMNPVAEKLTGWPLNEARTRPLTKVLCIVNSQTRKPAENPVTRVIREGKIVGLANHTALIARDGTEYQIADSAAPIRKRDGNIIGVVLVFRDITAEYKMQMALQSAHDELEARVARRTAELTTINEKLHNEILVRQKTEDALTILLKEKEILIKEVHHRVKNNLQTISSILDMSSMRVDDRQATHFFTDARAKIHTMALIHSQLYGSDKLGEIDMGIHIRELGGYLSEIYGKKKTIALSLDIPGIQLPIAQAMPCALVLNELISNALQHGFKNGQTGTIRLCIRKSPENVVVMSVKDDGMGIPEGLDIFQTRSLGLRLVRNLVQKQLRGKICLKRNKGTEIVAEFETDTEETKNG